MMNSKYQELFNLLSDEHELTLLESEMEEIIIVVDKINKRDLLEIELDFVNRNKNLRGIYYCSCCNWAHSYIHKRIVEHLESHRKPHRI